MATTRSKPPPKAPKKATPPKNPAFDPARDFPLSTEQDPVQMALSQLALLCANKKLVGQLGKWVEALAAKSPPKELREPNIRFDLFRRHVVSLLQMVFQNWEFINQRVRVYEYSQAERTARLLIAAELLQRFRNSVLFFSSPKDSEKKGDENKGTAKKPRTLEEVVQERGWLRVSDAIEALQAAESHFVTRGAAALIQHPDVLEQFLADTDDGSFEDAFDDVRRRVNIANQYAELFAKVELDSQALASYEELLADANTFYQGRELQNISAKQITYQRNLAFTLLLQEVNTLHIVLRSAYVDRPAVLEQVEGRYWKRLHKISRRKQKAKTTKTPPISAPAPENPPPAPTPTTDS